MVFARSAQWSWDGICAACPWAILTEGNIGKISSVLSTDMVFIEENCMRTTLPT
ncbi:MAG: hypothetical protein ACLVD8_26310 [Enterocloster sp.]|uniref:hypothetical protein n=1 Tax=Enterocloster sp. TaxID=2719315 RepID=UPI00399AABB7